MKIGELAKRAKVNIQTLRFYERRKLLKPVGKLDSGYRVYDSQSLKQLMFIKKAQGLGFSLEEIRGLLELRFESQDSCHSVRKRAEEKLSTVKEKIKHLRRMERALRTLIEDCHAKKVSDGCPILDKMKG